MSDIFIPEEAIAILPEISGSAAKVLIALASFMGEGGICHDLSRAEIGKRAGINRLSTISNAIGELKQAGILGVKRSVPTIGYRLVK